MLLLTHAGGPTLVASQLRLLPLPDDGLAVIRIVFYEEDKEGGEDEGETADAHEVPENRGELRRWEGMIRLDHRGQEQEWDT